MCSPNAAGQIRRTDVQLHVAELIDPQHLGDDEIVTDLSERNDPGHQQVDVDLTAEIHQVDAVAQVRGGGAEHVAAGERRARRRQLVLEVRQLHGAFGAADHRDGGCEQPVVGADQDAFTTGDLDRHRPTGRADTGVDHGEHDAGAT